MHTALFYIMKRALFNTSHMAKDTALSYLSFPVNEVLMVSVIGTCDTLVGVPLFCAFARKSINCCGTDCDGIVAEIEDTPTVHGTCAWEFDSIDCCIMFAEGTGIVFCGAVSPVGTGIVGWGIDVDGGAMVPIGIVTGKECWRWCPWSWSMVLFGIGMCDWLIELWFMVIGWGGDTTPRLCCRAANCRSNLVSGGEYGSEPESGGESGMWLHCTQSERKEKVLKKQLQ